MADTTSFFSAVENRRSLYGLTGESTIPDSRVKEIVEFTIKHTPSPYNVQSARAVVVLGDHHRKLWNELILPGIKELVPSEVFENYLQGAIKGHAAAYGTVMFFEDEESLDTLSEKNAIIQPMIPSFSEQSAGMHHFVTWTALEAEGLGCSAQHFNFIPSVTQGMRDTWGLSDRWRPSGQIVFGKVGARGGPRGVKEFKPVEGERVKVFA